uniref:FLYWCH-type domain-containing protein n=1 Tax=Syphacia muris TaxID=451379 RepID=A0A0N5AZF1_9BILA
MTEDYGEPIYVEAHGGKNNVILYRSKTNPNLAVEFFFRSCSKDGRSRYYRCTKCWYLYKTRRGNCATMIVRDGRIVTDPENPTVPHQCSFRPLEAVAANRAWIAGRKRKSNMNELAKITQQADDAVVKQEDSSSFNLENIFGLHCDDSIKAEVSSVSSNCANGVDCDSVSQKASATESDSEMASPSAVSHASTDSIESNNNTANNAENAAQQSSTSDCFTPCTSRTTEFIDLINSAFTDSMQKRSDDALEKLRQAVELKEAFEIDDVSLIDNVFSAQLVKSNDEQRLLLCEEWINLLSKIPPTANARWMTHYQFSIYYCFHMIALVTGRLKNSAEKKRFYDLSQEFFKGLLALTCNIHDSPEEVMSTKLDILLSLSFICSQYYDVCNEGSATYVEEELKPMKESFTNCNFAPDIAAVLVQKICRIESNLEEFKWSFSRK